MTKSHAPADSSEGQYTHEERRRIQCNRLRFWMVCAAKRCRRAKSCEGDPEQCFDRWWPHMPEEAKVYIRAAIRAMARKGMDKMQARQAAEAEVERWKETARANAERTPPAEPVVAREPAAPPDPDATRFTPESRAPRVRSL